MSLHSFLFTFFCNRKISFGLSVEDLGGQVGGDFGLPLVTVGQKLLLIVKKLNTSLRSKLKVGTLDNGVDRARFLAEATVDALGHVNIVTGSATRTVSTGLSLNGDGASRADSLAQLAGNTSVDISKSQVSDETEAERGGNSRSRGTVPFLTRLVSAESMLTTEARAKRTLFERIVKSGGLGEHVAGGDPHALENLRQQVVTSSIVP
jgi:hypothetical protein